MPVYRLTPIEESKQNPQWSASSIQPYCLWILAGDEYDARSAVAKATAVPGGQTLAPWKDPELVACEYDDSKDVAPGVIHVRNTPQAVAARQREGYAAA